MRPFAITFGIILILVFAGLWVLQTTDSIPLNEEVAVPEAEAAELAGFQFIQDALLTAQASDGGEAAGRVYNALSANARATIAADAVATDIAAFLSIEEFPEQGVSVEDLQINSPTAASLIVGLNYSTGPILRSINMIVEDGEWKIDSVAVLEAYPPEAEITPEPLPGDTEPAPTPAPAPEPVTQGACYVGGCSGQVCSDDPNVMTTCEWREEYACYQDATCERQTDGECGWTQTEQLTQCLAEATNS